MSKRRNKIVRRALDALPLIPAVLVSATSGQADQPKPPPPHPKAPPPPNKQPALPKFKDTNVLQISELRLDPALPKAGEAVTVTLRVQNSTGSALSNVEWKLTGALNKNGTIKSLGANASQVVTQSELRDWTKIPVLTDALFPDLDAEARDRRIDDAFEKSDKSSYRFEGWTAVHARVE